MRTIIKPLIVVATLALTGCAVTRMQPSLAHSNPASPNAPEASYPATTAILMTGTNFAMNSQAEPQPMPAHSNAHGEMKMDKPMPDAHRDHNAPNQ